MRYRFGIIFNFARHLKMNDPTDVFADVDQEKLLREIVRFLTEDVYNPREAREQCNEMEYFISLLYDRGIVQDHHFHLDETYVKICAILFAICEAMVDVFDDTGFYRFCQSYVHDKPRVIHISRNNFAIVVRPRPG